MLMLHCLISTAFSLDFLKTEDPIMNSRRLAGATVVGVLLIGSFGFGAQRFYYSSPLQKYSTDLTELKKRFNADKKKVRLLMLLSPT